MAALDAGAKAFVLKGVGPTCSETPQRGPSESASSNSC